MPKIKRNPAAREIAHLILSQYDPQSSKDLDEALKDILGTAFEEMLQGEMDAHLGYPNNSKEPMILCQENGHYYWDSTISDIFTKDFFRFLP